MITYEQIQAANATLPRLSIKGKQYAAVPARVQAFRQICPNGSIKTEIISLDDGVVTMMTTIKDEFGNTLATGFAQEKESASYINKTSYIENCETSAVGRALGFIGLGSESSMASAEEMVNAMTNQSATPATITEEEQQVLKNLCAKRGLDPAKIFPKGLDLTPEQYVEAVATLTKNKAKE